MEGNKTTVQVYSASQDLNSSCRHFDKLLSAYVCQLSNTSLSIPSNGDSDLKLYTPFICIQAYIYPRKPFSIEVKVLSKSRNTQTLLFSSQKQGKSDPKSIYVRFNKGKWANFCFCLQQFLGHPLSFIKSIKISGFGRLKQILCLKYPIVDIDLSHPFSQHLPKHLDFPVHINSLSVLITPNSLKRGKKYPQTAEHVKRKAISVQRRPLVCDNRKLSVAKKPRFGTVKLTKCKKKSCLTRLVESLIMKNLTGSTYWLKKVQVNKFSKFLVITII